MKTTSLRVKPPAARESRIQSSIGRPITSTSVFGTSAVLGPRRLPRPAPIKMGRIAPENISAVPGREAEAEEAEDGDASREVSHRALRFFVDLEDDARGDARERRVGLVELRIEEVDRLNRHAHRAAR